VIRAPSAVTSAEEWLRLYAPQDVTDEIEIDGEAETALTHPCAQWPSLAHITSSGLWRLIFQQGP
jgi:hypothetical protein